MTNHTDLKSLILSHYTNNPGVMVHYTTLGTTWREGNPIHEELIAEGKLEWRKVPSKSGKTMQRKLFAV
jgi:hypothetical protein